jgi:S-layer protein (TIGR01567 family)
MAMKRYLQGIAIVVMILGMLSVGMAAFTIDSKTPSSDPVFNVSGDLIRSFSISTSNNATVEWLINGTTVNTSLSNVTTSTYINNSIGVGNWNVTAKAMNSSNLSEIAMVLWSWIVSPIASVETAPNIIGLITHTPKDTNATITFFVDQANANTRVHYSTDANLISGVMITWNNTTTNPKTILLSALSPGNQYYYSVYAHNNTNNSLYTNSSIRNFNTTNPTVPIISNLTNTTPSNSSVSITYNVDQSNALAFVNYGIVEGSLNINSSVSFSGYSRNISLTSLDPGTKYFYRIIARNGTNQSYENISQTLNFTTKNPPPTINIITPPNSSIITVGDSVFVEVRINQDVNVSWTAGSSTKGPSLILANGSSNFTFKPADKGIYNITLTASNSNDTVTKIWALTVTPTTFSSGNRIWDGSKPLDFALKYSWTPMSFSGFYYNAKDDVGNENITIDLGSNYNTRTISKGNLVYTTSPQEVTFTHSNFGKYQVIGFMAEKFFAGYTINTSSAKTRPTATFDGKSAVGQGQLHKVLIDDDTKRTISVGGTLALQEGYVLKATDIDLNARTMLLSLMKDGNEVDVAPLSADETYVYSKRVGGVEDLPLIMVRFDSVFSGQELQVAFMKGLFQISETPTIIQSGNKFRNLEVTQVSNNLIEMKNSNDIGLTKGSTVDIMGDVKILVANNDDPALRFALSVEKTGDFEIRSTVYKGDDTTPIREWTPYNFGMNIGKTSIGFYYDLDSGIGNEKLNLVNNISGRSIPDQGLTYSTSPDEVKFTYTGFGKYQVIGFMADKYFAGYTNHTNPTVTRPTTDFAGKSPIANGALHKVLIDDDTKRTISVGGTIALKEGYVIKATDIDLNARVMLLSLLKDGSEVDITPLGAGETYVYAKTVSGTESLPLIMVRFDNVFSGQELQVAFLKGIFQISDTPIVVKVADQFGKMDVRSVSGTGITMSNDGSIGLDKNKNDVLMGNIKLKVADNDNLRFYFAVDVTPAMVASQLAIDAPTKAMAGDTIKIRITAGGVGMDNATINIGTDSGTTDKNGTLNYTLPRDLKGTYSITASRTGYEKATQNIEIEKYVDYRLSIEAPSQSNQFETITIKVLYNGSAMSGATVIFDNTTVGTSDSNGEVTYKLETSGTHSISASKKSYITVTRDIEIREPYSEFKGLDINITPNPGFAGEAFLVRANITNVGTKSDSIQVDLVVNGTAVNNKTITLGAKGKVEVNFTRIEPKAGNVTVEIMGQSMLYEAKVKPTNYLLIGAIVTGIGAVIIYILTSKGLLSLEMLKHQSILLKDAVNLQAQKLSMLFKK